MLTRTVVRSDDMKKGDLTITVQEDGDVIVGFRLDPLARPTPCPSVEFCVPGAGGGKSPHTRKALLKLIEAMEKDNEEKE